MTVKELRQLLFDIENQDAEIAIVTSAKYGKIETTKTVTLVEPDADPNFTLLWLV